MIINKQQAQGGMHPKIRYPHLRSVTFFVIYRLLHEVKRNIQRLPLNALSNLPLDTYNLWQLITYQMAILVHVLVLGTSYILVAIHNVFLISWWQIAGMNMYRMKTQNV